MAEAARDFSGNMQVGEFLRFLKSRPKEERWQLVEGVAVMMNPPRMRHQQIALNLRDLLKDALEKQGRRDLLAMTEVGVRVRGVSNFLPRPDVVVVPGIAGDEVYAEHFLLVSEVLSPSNTKSLITQKLRLYKGHPDNLYCLVIDSRRAWMEIHARAKEWVPVVMDDLANVFELPEFALRSTLGDLYRHTPLDPMARRPG
jgi:Uma2 family endonuclease